MTLSAQNNQDGVKCPNCRGNMVLDQQDNFYRCQVCKWEFWPAETKMVCAACGRAMRFVKAGYYKCSGCGSECWPPEEAEEEEDPEHRRSDYSGWGLVYLNEIRRGHGHSKSCSGRKKKKKGPMPKVLSQRYLLP